MGDLTDDAMRRDVMSNWEAGAEAAIRKDWERDVVESNRTYYEIETDRHACADEESDNTPKLGKISPDEAVILIKNMRIGPTMDHTDYNSKFLGRIREILARLDMKS